MKPISVANALLSWSASAAAAAAAVPAADHELRIPTSYESAVLGRRILALTPLGTLSTVFPKDKDSSGGASAEERRPAGLAGLPYALMEYVADCEDVGNPTILAIGIGTTFKNAAAGSNVSLALHWTPPHPPTKRIKSETKRSWLSYLGLGDNTDDDVEEGHHHHHHHHDIALPYSAANLPRFSLLGHLEPIEGGDDREGQVGSKLASCFVQAHPDAKYWLPGNKIHTAHFVKLVVEQVYWVGGFGDRAYIGWIPVEEWQGVTSDEWQKARLPGEKKGWSEWTVPQDL